MPSTPRLSRTFAFISALRAEFDLLICVGGGIADGAGVAGAVAAGADLVYVGTRFLASEESLATPGYKNMVVASRLEDLVVSAAVTGTPASWLIPSLIACGYDPAQLGGEAARDYGGEAAKRWKDVWAAGQGIGAVRSTEPLAQIVDELEDGFLAALDRMSGRAQARFGGQGMKEEVRAT